MCVAVMVWFQVYATVHAQRALTLTFLDVGQGDSILITSPTQVQVLIDGGKDRIVLRRLAEEMPFYDRSIDMLVATHPDADHITGLIDVLERYKVATLVHPGVLHDTPATESLFTLVAEERQRRKGHSVSFTEQVARRGYVYDIGGGAVLRVLFPDRDATHFETNTASIVMRLEYGATSALLTGDSPAEIEKYLISIDGVTLKSDILKLGHHGSDTSSSEEFLGYVNPEWGIVSAGKDNSYGHPHQEIVDRLNRFGISMKNTVDEGSVTFTSNGKEWREVR